MPPTRFTRQRASSPRGSWPEILGVRNRCGLRTNHVLGFFCPPCRTVHDRANKESSFHILFRNYRKAFRRPIPLTESNFILRACDLFTISLGRIDKGRYYVGSMGMTVWFEGVLTRDSVWNGLFSIKARPFTPPQVRLPPLNRCRGIQDYACHNAIKSRRTGRRSTNCSNRTIRCGWFGHACMGWTSAAG